MTTPARPRARRPRAWRPPKVTPRLLRRMVRRLVEHFDPDQLILFGSHARGDARPDSDVDLLVVMPVKRADKAKVEIAMGVALHDIPIPKDVIVVSPEEVARYGHLVGTIIRPALEEGKTLYARA